MRMCCCVWGRTDTRLGQDSLCPIHSYPAKVQNVYGFYCTVIIIARAFKVGTPYLDNVFPAERFVRIRTANE